MYDIELEKQIKDLKEVIYSWAQRRNLWHDCAFKSWIEYFDDEPLQNPCILILCSSGQLGEILNWDSYEDELLEEFEELIQTTNFCYEYENDGVFTFWVNNDDELEEAYHDYFKWQWICELIQPDFSDLYEEVYERFYKSPGDLYNLQPRKFEILLDGIFRNNGFRTELGAGQSDGGVDLRLYHNDGISEALTLVQVKKYAENRPINLEAVSALKGTVDDERANKGLFITTSRYLPCAKKFAERQNKRITLATSDDVKKWSSVAFNRIISDKSSLIQYEYLRDLLNNKDSKNTLEGKIFYTSKGYTMTLNSFAIVLRESKGAVLLMKLPNTKIGENFEWRGYELPDLGIKALSHLNEDDIFRAKKYQENGKIYLRGNQELYFLWDGKPKYYDLLD